MFREQCQIYSPLLSVALILSPIAPLPPPPLLTLPQPCEVRPALSCATVSYPSLPFLPTLYFSSTISTSSPHHTYCISPLSPEPCTLLMANALSSFLVKMSPPSVSHSLFASLTPPRPLRPNPGASCRCRGLSLSLYSKSHYFLSLMGEKKIETFHPQIRVVS